jgi:hypothetical protein
LDNNSKIQVPQLKVKVCLSIERTAVVPDIKAQTFLGDVAASLPWTVHVEKFGHSSFPLKLPQEGSPWPHTQFPRRELWALTVLLSFAEDPVIQSFLEADIFLKVSDKVPEALEGEAKESQSRGPHHHGSPGYRQRA